MSRKMIMDQFSNIKDRRLRHKLRAKIISTIPYSGEKTIKPVVLPPRVKLLRRPGGFDK